MPCERNSICITIRCAETVSTSNQANASNGVVMPTRTPVAIRPGVYALSSRRLPSSSASGAAR